MSPLGQLRHLPRGLSESPCYPLMVRFARFKVGSFELLFTIERHLLRWSWVALLAMFALVLPTFEEVDGLSTLVRLSTLIYPCLFLWSLTRLAGVELLQLALEARWTGELLASPLSDRDLAEGFIAPIWIVVRQYFLISLFSLVLYGLETGVYVVDDGRLLGIDEMVRKTLFTIVLFFNTIAWIIFLYVSRLWIEIRLRNGLLKGLATLALLLAGAGIFTAYLLLMMRWPWRMTDTLTLVLFGVFTAALAGAAVALHLVLRRRFRRYLCGQVDLDPLIQDQIDPRASAWSEVEPAV